MFMNGMYYMHFVLFCHTKISQTKVLHAMLFFTITIVTTTKCDKLENDFLDPFSSLFMKCKILNSILVMLHFTLVTKSFPIQFFLLFQWLFIHELQEQLICGIEFQHHRIVELQPQQLLRSIAMKGRWWQECEKQWRWAFEEEHGGGGNISKM